MESLSGWVLTQSSSLWLDTTGIAVWRCFSLISSDLVFLSPLLDLLQSLCLLFRLLIIQEILKRCRMSQREEYLASLHRLTFVAMSSCIQFSCSFLYYITF